MKTDKKQLPQLIVLGLLVVACIGFVSFQFMGPKPAKNAASSGSPAEKPAASSPAQATAVVTEDVIASGVFPELATVPSRRDPFMEQHLPGQRSNAAVTVGQASTRPVRIPVGPVPPIGVGGFGPSLAPGGAPAVTVVPDETKFSLTGVVRGEKNVAILRTGDGGRYVVRQGESVNGRYKVLMVTDDAVVLSDGSRRIYVKLGGEQNAS